MAMAILPSWCADINVDELIEWRFYRAHPENMPLPRAGCYFLINLITWNVYIGISGNVLHRLARRGRSASEPKLSAAFKEYGRENFLALPICYAVGEDNSWLPEAEAGFITDFDAVRNGYNTQTASGGCGPAGDEFRKIIKSSWSDKTSTANRQRLAGLAKAVEACKTEEFSTKMSAIVTARYADPLYTPPPITEDTRKKLRDAKKRAPLMWITNGTVTRSVIASTPIPDGWREGQAPRKPYVWITDGTRSKRLLIGEPIPGGWRHGLSTSVVSGSKHWITNGVESRQVAISEPIPEGWRTGRTVSLEERDRFAKLGRQPRTDADRAATSTATRAAMADPAVRAKLRKPRQIGPWVNNGTVNRRLRPGEAIPPGWSEGRFRRE